MAWLHLVVKDVKEHGLALLSLTLAFLLVVLATLGQISGSEFSMSGLQAVWFAMITVVPLVTLIVANRLIVREYIGGTRLFVEALPIGSVSVLVTKFFTGLLYLCMLVTALVLMVVITASTAEGIDQRYLGIVLAKSLSVLLLFWSIAFSFSFCGKVRLALYVLLGLVLLLFINNPAIDESRFAPMGLLDRDLFAFERSEIPWRQLIETNLFSVFIAAAGFILATINEGSVAERLSKPLSRRDMGALILIVLASMTVYATLQKSWKTESYAFSGSTVIRTQNPAVAVMYQDEQYRARAEVVMARLVDTLEQLQADVGLSEMPAVRVALNQDIEQYDIDARLRNGVSINANFIDNDYFDDQWVVTIAVHHALLAMTNGRMDFETRHWLLDGFARWWTEGADTANVGRNNTELLALAVFAAKRMPEFDQPLLRWQSIMDVLGYELADAIAYSAILYLQQSSGTEAVVKLAADYIGQPIGSSSIQSVKRLFRPDDKRFARITGQSFSAFSASWLNWLQEQAKIDAVAKLLSEIPQIDGRVNNVIDDAGVQRLDASYKALAGYRSIDGGNCVFRHQPASPFDEETGIYAVERDRGPCLIDSVAHTVTSEYAAGDRVYVQLEYETPAFHRPVVLYIGRIHVQ